MNRTKRDAGEERKVLILPMSRCSSDAGAVAVVVTDEVNHELMN